MESNLAEHGIDGVASQGRLAARVWDMLQRTITVGEIATVIAAEFGLPRDRALNQTRRCLEYFNQADFDCRRF